MIAVPTKCASYVAIVALSSSAKSDLCGTKGYRVIDKSSSQPEALMFWPPSLKSPQVDGRQVRAEVVRTAGELLSITAGSAPVLGTSPKHDA
jgi:hypothetical protein